MNIRHFFKTSGRDSRSPFPITVAIVLGLLLVLSACGGEEEPEAVTELVMDEIVVASPTPRPTATPIPTAAPTQVPTATPETVTLDDGTTMVVEAGEEVVVQQQPLIEPQTVEINFREGILNDWIEVVPPPGWILSKGVDGIILSKEPEGLPNSSFALVRRWGNSVNTGDWVAYLPDGFEERDSNVTIRMGGFDWDGVFVTNSTNTYRAFFAVNNDSIPAYTVLVYVPYPDDRATPAGEITREEMALFYQEEVGDLNTILRRFLFS